VVEGRWWRVDVFVCVDRRRQIWRYTSGDRAADTYLEEVHIWRRYISGGTSWRYRSGGTDLEVQIWMDGSADWISADSISCSALA
jgi:hypothetical protein